jgi:hypothetical protein
VVKDYEITFYHKDAKIGLSVFFVPSCHTIALYGVFRSNGLAIGYMG